MTPATGEHGFTRVDKEGRPGAWVECLDRLHGEPFYREYKDRVRAILAPRPTGRYLEIGAGVGTDALAVEATVIGVDQSLTMCREARVRGLMLSVVGDAEALPFPSGLVDGCWSDRTFQHLAHPDRALAEMVRVLKPGGTIVVVDPDYGTQVMELSDRRLALGLSGSSRLTKRYAGTPDGGQIRRGGLAARVRRGEDTDCPRSAVAR